MNDDVSTQILYLKHRFTELTELCDKETSDAVTNQVRNVAQDIFTRLNRLLDQIMYSYFDEKIAPSFSHEERKKLEKKVQFPICEKEEEITIQLGRFGAADLISKDPKIFQIIANNQPYINNQNWLRLIRKYSNLGHRKLIAQKKKKQIDLILGELIRIDSHSSVQMNNVKVNGIQIDKLIVDNGVIDGKIDERLNPRIEISVSYLIENDNVDLLLLCQESIDGIEKIAKQFSERNK